MTNQGIDLSTLTEKIVELENVELSETQSEELYQVFLTFASILAPAITTHLMKKCLTPEQLQAWKSPEGLEVGPRGAHLREYNSKLIARLVYDLKPAISGAFNNGANTVDAIVRDLRFDNPPIALKSIPSKPKGAGGKHHRDLRSTARRRLYELIVYESNASRTLLQIGGLLDRADRQSEAITKEPHEMTGQELADYRRQLEQRSRATELILKNQAEKDGQCNSAFD